MKRVILALGTCISQWVQYGIGLVPECADKFEFAYQFGSVERVVGEIPDDVLKRVVLIIQDLGPWQPATHLTEAERDLIPGDAVTVNIPTLHFNSLWPFLAVDPRNKPVEGFPWGRYPMPWTDRIGIEAVRSLGTIEERLEFYRNYDLSKVDLDHFHNTQLVNQIMREQNSEIKVGAFVASTFQDKQLYHVHHHPSATLITYILAQLYTHPKFLSIYRGNVGEMVARAKDWFEHHDPFIDEQIPIHPHVARHFNLKWWRERMEYSFHGKKLTHEQWIAEYMKEDILTEAAE